MKEMKGILRVPTKTQYAFIEIHAEGSPKEMVDVYNELNEAYWGQGTEGLPQKEWNKVLDKYLGESGISEDQMTKLSEKQSWLLHELDKAFSRIKNRI